MAHLLIRKDIIKNNPNILWELLNYFDKLETREQQVSPIEDPRNYHFIVQKRNVIDDNEIIHPVFESIEDRKVRIIGFAGSNGKEILFHDDDPDFFKMCESIFIPMGFMQTDKSSTFETPKKIYFEKDNVKICCNNSGDRYFQIIVKGNKSTMESRLPYFEERNDGTIVSTVFNLNDLGDKFKKTLLFFKFIANE